MKTKFDSLSPMRQLTEIVMCNLDLNIDEAHEIINETREMILNEPDMAEDIMMSQLGLEPDYIMNLF